VWWKGEEIMAKFKVEYSNGVVQEHEQSDCHTVEQFINCRFGSCDTSSVKVTLLEEVAPKKTAKK
jgi:hypothetical protein